MVIQYRLIHLNSSIKKANVKPVDNSLVGGGCVITDASISNSVLFDRIKIDEDSSVDHCVVLPQVQIGKIVH